ncbi:MAG: hypothetical protein Q3982_02965, partial [Phoenicibacter congonensis]|nr:hypothetical protein [Phoenicibacter congonensis]
IHSRRAMIPRIMIFVRPEKLKNLLTTGLSKKLAGATEGVACFFELEALAKLGLLEPETEVLGREVFLFEVELLETEGFCVLLD